MLASLVSADGNDLVITFAEGYISPAYSADINLQNQNNSWCCNFEEGELDGSVALPLWYSINRQGWLV